MVYIPHRAASKRRNRGRLCNLAERDSETTYQKGLLTLGFRLGGGFAIAAPSHVFVLADQWVDRVAHDVRKSRNGRKCRIQKVRPTGRTNRVSFAIPPASQLRGL